MSDDTTFDSMIERLDSLTSGGPDWTEGLPHMEVRRFIFDHLRKRNAGPDLDEAVCRFLHVDDVRPVTTDLQAALSLIPAGWWWRLSHLEASVTPTKPAPGMEGVMSNSALYDEHDRPVSYTAHVLNDRSALPIAVCEAVLKAVYDLPTALVVQTSKADEIADRMRTHTSLHRLRRKAAVRPTPGDAA